MLEFKAKVVLVDIEGTTTLISFVKETLFPYAKENCQHYLKQTWTTELTKSIVNDLIALPEYREFCQQTDSSEVITIEQITKFVIHLINLDLKLKPLKTLQGLVWEDGYKRGILIGHVFDDVPKAFKLWHSKKIRIAIYSSGSIYAQKLLFGQTNFGNLLDYISEHFDTTSGMKTESNSYENIVKNLNVEASEVLFLTDILAEAEAAQAAGVQTALLRRPGNAELPENVRHSHAFVNNFEELDISL